MTTTLDVKRVDHLSYTVGDIDRSVNFYAKFGFETVNRYTAAGPELDVAAATEHADMDIQLLRRPADGIMLELISYTRHPSDRAARNSEVGAAHLAFVVGDIQVAYEQLLADGVQFLSEPNTDKYGEQWVYLRDPDGITVELMQPNADSARAVAQ
jgi:catechol 2,3-dioxygenase-like lactoylglutathione lyase family enzyme